MSPRLKKEYIEAIFLRYKKASYQERTIILDEFCATCGYHRKHAIRLLRRFRRFIKPKLRKRGRSPVYHRDFILKPLKQIWLAANLPCSKRLKVILPLWLPSYVQSFGNLPSEVSQKTNISGHPFKRHLSREKLPPQQEKSKFLTYRLFWLPGHPFKRHLLGLRFASLPKHTTVVCPEGAFYMIIRLAILLFFR
jgi:hypothetical protein